MRSTALADLGRGPEVALHPEDELRRAESSLRMRELPQRGATFTRVNSTSRQALRQAWQRWGPGELGAVVAATALTIGLIEAATSEQSPASIAAITVALAALLFARRVAPLLVLEGVFLALFVTSEVNDGSTMMAAVLAMAVASANVGLELPPRRALWAPAMIAGTFAGLLAADLVTLPVSEFVGIGLLYGGALIAGALFRQRAERARELEERAVTLERERDAEARRAVEAERARIARELHDIVSHSIAVIAVQTQSVRKRLGERSPDEVRDLQEIETVARQAMGEMRRLLGVLRSTGDPADLAPQPGLAQIESLLAKARSDSREVALHVEGEAVPLAPGVDLAAYRVVQEAVTNVLKHTAATRVDVTLRYFPSALEVLVEDNGAGGSDRGRTQDGGYGLVGMRERIALYEGTLDYGAAPGGGFQVRAHLPIREGVVP